MAPSSVAYRVLELLYPVNALPAQPRLVSRYPTSALSITTVPQAELCDIACLIQLDASSSLKSFRFFDRLAIRDLIDRYNDAVNHRDWAALRETFTEDAIWEVAAPVNLRFQGAGEIAGGIRGSVGRQEFLVQSSSAIVIEQTTSELASARSTMIEMGRPKEGGPGMHAAGTYYDELAKVNGKWRFKHRIFRVRYMDEIAVPGKIYENVAPKSWQRWNRGKRTNFASNVLQLSRLTSPSCNSGRSTCWR